MTVPGEVGVGLPPVRASHHLDRVEQGRLGEAARGSPEPTEGKERERRRGQLIRPDTRKLETTYLKARLSRKEVNSTLDFALNKPPCLVVLRSTCSAGGAEPASSGVVSEDMAGGGDDVRLMIERRVSRELLPGVSAKVSVPAERCDRGRPVGGRRRELVFV